MLCCCCLPLPKLLLEEGDQSHCRKFQKCLSHLRADELEEWFGFLETLSKIENIVHHGKRKHVHSGDTLAEIKTRRSLGFL